MQAQANAFIEGGRDAPAKVLAEAARLCGVKAQFRTKLSAVEGNIMATYVTLYNFTDQGLRNIKDTVKRVEAAKKAATAAGITIKELVWTQGQYDLVAISEAPDEVVANAFAE